MSFYENQLKLKAEELISKTIKINEANRALAAANQKLESKTAELNNSEKIFSLICQLKKGRASEWIT